MILSLHLHHFSALSISREQQPQPEPAGIPASGPCTSEGKQSLPQSLPEQGTRAQKGLLAAAVPAGFVQQQAQPWARLLLAGHLSSTGSCPQVRATHPSLGFSTALLPGAALIAVRVSSAAKV